MKIVTICQILISQCLRKLVLLFTKPSEAKTKEVARCYLKRKITVLSTTERSEELLNYSVKTKRNYLMYRIIPHGIV